MPDSSTSAIVDNCDGKDHGVTPARMDQLRQEAYAFNRLLSVSESDQQGPAHDSAVAAAKKSFYSFLPGAEQKGDGSNIGRAFDASQAFYNQLTELPVGERKALLNMALKDNQSMSVTDPALPRMELSMGSDAYINLLQVDYPEPSGNDAQGRPQENIAEEFTFRDRSMCAEYSSQPPEYPGSPPWSIDLPSLAR